jgi:hypothetical protein
VRDTQSFKGMHLLSNSNTHVFEIGEAAKRSEVILTARDLQKAQDAAEVLKNKGYDVYPRALEVTDEQKLVGIAA